MVSEARKWWRRWLLGGVLVALWVGPWLERLEKPLVFGDDVLRLIDVQTMPVGPRLFRPFNEHFAPCFELWTEGVWRVAGRRLARVPVVFTMASLVPFLMVVPMMWGQLTRAWGDKAAAGLAATMLACTPVHAETVFWFSASSFVWALLFTWLAMAAMGRAVSDGGCGGAAVWSAVCAAIAPMWSGVGLLAGPAAAAVGWFGTDRGGWKPAMQPLIGTGLAVLVAMAFRHDVAVARSAREYLDVRAGLERIPEALAYLVGVGFLGLGVRKEPERWVGALILLILTVLSMGTPRERRGWVAAGWVLLLGGYVLTFGIRVHVLVGESLIRTTRYHLFPCAGLGLIVAGSSPWRFWQAVVGSTVHGDERNVGMAAVVGLAGLMVMLSAEQRRERLRYYDFLGEQAGTLRALDRLAEEGAREGLTRGEVLEALEPVRPRWVHHDCNALGLLPEMGSRPSGRGPEEVRRVLRSRLSEGERRALGAFRDLSGSLVRGEGGGRRELEPYRLAGVLGEGTRLWTPGAPAFVEYRIGEGWSSRVLGLPGSLEGREIELWWVDSSGRWSRDQVVWLKIPPGESGAPGCWDLPLAGLGCETGEGPRFVRLVARVAGELDLGGANVGE